MLTRQFRVYVRALTVLAAVMFVASPAEADWKYTQREMQFAVKNALERYYPVGKVDCLPFANHPFRLHRRYHRWRCVWAASYSASNVYDCSAIWRITGSHEKNRYYAVEFRTMGRGCKHRPSSKKRKWRVS